MNWRWLLHIVLGITLLTNQACKKAVFEVQPLIYGHAGTALSEERTPYPPNSEAAIFYAIDVLNADGVEVDIQMTKDSVLVLYHDPFFEPNLSSFENTITCIAEINWDIIEQQNKNEKHPILKLSNLIEKIKGKKLILDLKHYNYCSEQLVNIITFNNALENELSNLNLEDKTQIILNSRNSDLLNAIENEAYQKSFETDEIELGISYAETFDYDLLTIKLNALTPQKANMLKTANLDYCIFGVKIKQEIKSAAKYEPIIIVSDNIAGLKRHYN